MNIKDLIIKKRNKEELNEEEIGFFVNAYNKDLWYRLRRKACRRKTCCFPRAGRDILRTAVSRRTSRRS